MARVWKADCFGTYFLRPETLADFIHVKMLENFHFNFFYSFFATPKQCNVQNCKTKNVILRFSNIYTVLTTRRCMSKEERTPVC